MIVPGFGLATREVRHILLMCFMVCAGAWVSTQLSIAVGTVSCIWIANGIIAAFVLTAPPKWKSAFFVAGQMANLVVDLAHGNTIRAACWFAMCNSLEVLVPVLVLRHIGERAEVTTRQKLWKIALFGVVLGPLSCALLAAPAVRMIEGRPLLDAARIWFLADSLGCAATLPPMLLLLTRNTTSSSPWRVLATDLAWASLLATVGLAVFWQTRYPLIFLLFPPLAVTVLRFRLEGAIYGTSRVVVIAAACTAEAHGPFVLFHAASPAERVMLFQLFGLVIFGSGIPLGLSVEERHRLAEHLKEANGKLADLALVDPLTGLRNRRTLDDTIESEWMAAAAKGTDISLIYVDIDFFKRFNDTYGHQPGDDCLRAVARTLVGSGRGSSDCVWRYGGEEFLVLLPNASFAEAQAVAERIVAAIRDLAIPHAGSPFGVVTASFGIATVRPVDGDNPNRLIRLADEALYEAKRSGRHRIAFNANRHGLNRNDQAPGPGSQVVAAELVER